MARERWSDADDYTGDRSKGQRMGTLWFDPKKAEGDVTFFQRYDSEMDTLTRLDILIDCIGMLQREFNAQRSKLRSEMKRSGEKDEKKSQL